jgi:hypothetical protein
VVVEPGGWRKPLGQAHTVMPYRQPMVVVEPGGVEKAPGPSPDCGGGTRGVEKAPGPGPDCGGGTREGWRKPLGQAQTAVVEPGGRVEKAPGPSPDCGVHAWATSL